MQYNNNDKRNTALMREEEPRAPYEGEIAFYSTVSSGDVEKVKMLITEPISAKKGLGCLSRNLLTNLKYHTIITISMIARRCIEAGLSLSTSYSLSDFYIQQLDVCNTASDVDRLHDAAVMDYAQRMKNIRTQTISSVPVARSVDYIHDNIHEHITLETIACHIGISPAYLSRLFHRETGMTVRDYIRKCKVDAAAKMLEDTDYPMSDIAYILSFASQSYFAEMFKKQQGMTPTQWREKHLRARSIV